MINPDDGRLTVRTALLMMVSLVTISCAQRPGDATVVQDPPRGRGQLLLRMETSGGFVAPQQTLQQMPAFSLYGDGLTISPGAQIEIYPGPALPSLVATTLSDDGIKSLLDDALAAGLRGNHSYTSMSISDMPTTTFMLVVDGTTYTTSAYGLGAGVSTAGMSEAERQARLKLERFSEELSNLRAALPAGSVGRDRQYATEALRVFVQTYDGQRNSMLHEPETAWPLSRPLSSFEQKTSMPGVTCGTVTGTDVGPVLKAAEAANQLTPWTSNGQRYSLTFRVLLPDEHGC